MQIGDIIYREDMPDAKYVIVGKKSYGTRRLWVIQLVDPIPGIHNEGIVFDDDERLRVSKR